ncbi:MAG: hypothetical protein ABIP94_07055 [Planctomycetota bacterium]
MADLLRADRANPRLLLDGGHEYGIADLLRDVALIARSLPDPTPGSHIAFAFDRDRRAFLATLLAAWHRGHAAALPQNARLSAIGPVMARPEVVLLAHDTGAGTGVDVPSLLQGAPATDTSTGKELLRDVPLTGPLTVFWRHSHDSLHAQHMSTAALSTLLAKNVTELQLPTGALLCNTFCPAFPPALLPGLLAPLSAGATVVCEGDTVLAETPGECALAPHTLVAPASLLRTLAHSDLASRRLAQVVAVAAELDPSTVARLDQQHVLIARTTPLRTPDPRRTAVERVLFALDGPLAEALDIQVAIADLRDGPRAFATVTAVRPIDAHPMAVAGMPLEVRAVPSLPRDRDGQIDDAAVLHTFGRAADGSRMSHELQFEVMPPVDDTQRRFRTSLPLDFFAFVGHFPTYRVLSGAAQLHELVLPCLRLMSGGPVVTTAFSDLKFLSRIAPGDTVEIAVSSTNGSDIVDFEIRRDSVRCSAGRVTLRREAAAP